jgi:nucleotide-binding universal stress UspA family protein
VTVEEPSAIKSSRLDPQEAVSRAEQVLASAGLEASGEVLSGNPREIILNDAKKWNADLIVVGSHGRRGFKRFLLGSVSEAVAMNAHCSVVVVRRAAPTSRKARASG